MCESVCECVRVSDFDEFRLDIKIVPVYIILYNLEKMEQNKNKFLSHLEFLCRLHGYYTPREK